MKKTPLFIISIVLNIILVVALFLLVQNSFFPVSKNSGDNQAGEIRVSVTGNTDLLSNEDISDLVDEDAVIGGSGSEQKSPNVVQDDSVDVYADDFDISRITEGEIFQDLYGSCINYADNADTFNIVDYFNSQDFSLPDGLGFDRKIDCDATQDSLYCQFKESYSDKSSFDIDDLRLYVFGIYNGDLSYNQFREQLSTKQIDIVDDKEGNINYALYSGYLLDGKINTRQDCISFISNELMHNNETR